MSLPPLYEWQGKYVAEKGSKPKDAMYVSPRLGKTRAAGECIKVWDMPRGVVVPPLIVAPVWADLLGQMGFDVVNAYSGPQEARRERLLRAPSKCIIISNYDFLAGNIEYLLATKPGFVIGDESHLIKSPTAKRAKSFRRLAWRADNVRLLSGTPTANHYGDLWGQMVALDRGEWGTSYEKFAQRYLIRSAMFPSMVLGHRNTEELQERLLRYATFVRRDEAFGPDSWQFVKRTLALPPDAHRMYRQLVRDWLLADENVEAAHILKRLIRLQQLTSGFLPTEGGGRLEVHSVKSDAVVGDLSEIIASGEKVVIFHRFRYEGDHYVERIRQAYPKLPVYRLAGGTTVESRSTAIADFERLCEAGVVVVQTQAGGVGVSLASATHAFFVSRTFSFLEDEQARDRIYAPGKARCVTYYEIEESIDGYIAGILDTKRNIHTSITHADIKEIAHGILR